MLIFLINNTGVSGAKPLVDYDSLQVRTSAQRTSEPEVFPYSFGEDDYSVGFNKASISTNIPEENINIANGTINIKIKLLSLPMRGGKDYDLYITYNGSPLSMVGAGYSEWRRNEYPDECYQLFGCYYGLPGGTREWLGVNDFKVTSDMGNCGLGWNVMPGEASLMPLNIKTNIPCCPGDSLLTGFINLNDAGSVGISCFPTGGPPSWIVENKLDWDLEIAPGGSGVELYTPEYTYKFGFPAGDGTYSYTEYPLPWGAEDDGKRTIFLLCKMFDHNGNYIDIEWSGNANADEDAYGYPVEGFNTANYPPPAARIPKKICTPTDTCYIYRKTIEPDANKNIRETGEQGDPLYCLWNFYVIDSIVNIVNGERFKVNFHYHQEWFENTIEFWYGRQFILLDSIEFKRNGVRIKPPYRFSYAVDRGNAPELLPGELSGFQTTDGAQYEYEYKTMEEDKYIFTDINGHDHYRLTQYRAIDRKVVILPETGSYYAYTYRYDDEPSLKDASVGPQCPDEGGCYVPEEYYGGDDLFAKGHLYYPIYKKCEVTFPQYEKKIYSFIDSAYLAEHLEVVNRDDEYYDCCDECPRFIKPFEREEFYGKPYKIIEQDGIWNPELSRQEITLYYWVLGNKIVPEKAGRRSLHPVLKYKLSKNLPLLDFDGVSSGDIVKAYKYTEYDKYDNKTEYEFLGDVIYVETWVEENVALDGQTWKNKNLPTLLDITTEDNWIVKTRYLYQNNEDYENCNFCHLPTVIEKYKYPYDFSDIVSLTQIEYDDYYEMPLLGAYAQMADYGITHKIRGNITEKTEWINDTDTRTKKYQYDRCGNLVKMIDYMGNEYKYDYCDLCVFPDTLEYPNGFKEDFDFDKKGNLVKFTDKNGVIDTFKYDVYGRLKEYRKGTPGDLSLLGKYEYYDYDRRARTFSYYDDSNADVTNYYYDELGRLEMYEALGEPGKDVIKEYFYDDNGRLNKETVPRFNSTVNADTVKKEFDGLNKVRKIEYPSDGDDEFVEYFYNGYITDVKDEEGYYTTLINDASGNLIEVQDALGNWTDYDYDVNGNLLEIEDAEGKFIDSYYNWLGNLVKREGPDKGVDTFAYDDNGNIIYHKLNSGDEIEFEYDQLGRIKRKLVNDQYKEFYYYDSYTIEGYTFTPPSGLNHPKGRLTAFVNLNIGEVYFYDKFGNLCEKWVTLTPFVLPPEDIDTFKYSYDLKGRITEMEYSDGYTVEYEYDKLGNISSVIINDGDATVNLSSTAAGLLSGIHFPGEVADTFVYKPRNWMYGMGIWGIPNLYLRSFEYNKRGELMKEFEEPSHITTTQYTYDSLGQIKIEDREGTDNDHSFDYDKVGNRTRVDDNYYTYYNDPIKTNKLKNDDFNEYEYDDIGCISSKTNVNDTVDFFYNPEGMLTEVVISGEGAGHYKYYYKGNQRIRQENLVGGAEVEGFIYSCDVKSQNLTGGIVEAVFLDAGNNEIDSLVLAEISGTNDWMEVSGNIPEDDLPPGAVSLKLRVRRQSGSVGYLWVGDMNLEEGEWIISDLAYNYFYDNAGNLILVDDDNETTPPIRYIYAGNRLLATENNGNLYLYHLDRIGSPIMITNEDGNIVKEKKYEAFGNLVWSDGTYNDNREFTSKEKDPTGFHYFGARYYSGDIGRFLIPDPYTLYPGNIKLFNPQELNPYVYCTNNPLLYIDPNGEFKVFADIVYWGDFEKRGSRIEYRFQFKLWFSPEGPDFMPRNRPQPPTSLRDLFKRILEATGIKRTGAGRIRSENEDSDLGLEVMERFTDRKAEKIYREMFVNRERITRKEAEKFLKRVKEEVKGAEDLYEYDKLLDEADKDAMGSGWYRFFDWYLEKPPRSTGMEGNLQVIPTDIQNW
jgi:RHS repeat-associated protein